MRNTVDDAGIAAPLAFIAISSLLTVAMFPGPLLSGASGLLFGTALGTPISIVAATLGASLAFSLSRRFGARSVDELSGRRVRVVQDFIAAARLPVGAVRTDPAGDAVQRRQLRGRADAPCRC